MQNFAFSLLGTADYLEREVIIINSNDGNVRRFVPGKITDKEPLYLVQDDKGKRHYQVCKYFKTRV